MKYKILCTMGKKFNQTAKEILETIGLVDCLELRQSELARKVSSYNILLVGLGLNINRRIIDQAKDLKIIATTTTGLDHIDVNYAEKRNIKVISLKAETEFLNSITGTAELAIGLMIDLSRLTHPAFASVKKNQWDREKFIGHNLSGQTLGIVGLGRLGRWLARYGLAFNMKIIGYDPYLSRDNFLKAKCRQVDFKTLLRESDIISIHVHLTRETKNLFSREKFNKMKPSAYLINTSRGKIVKEADLLVALKNKKIAGYAADVLADELNFTKVFKKHPLVEYARKNNNCLIVPHIGGMTYESRAATDIFIANKVKQMI